MSRAETWPGVARYRGRAELLVSPEGPTTHLHVRLPRPARLEIIVPERGLEWHAIVRDERGSEIVADWMEYREAKPKNAGSQERLELEREREQDVSSFLRSVLDSRTRLRSVPSTAPWWLRWLPGLRSKRTRILECERAGAWVQILPFTEHSTAG